MSPVHTSASQAATSPADAVTLLVDGNERFVTGQATERDLLDQVTATAAGQYPVTAILSCIDSRVPPELIFDIGIGDAFVLRTAGNVVDDDVLGGLEFAVAVGGVKAIVVLGHSRCGAVKGACDGVELDHLTGLLAKIRPAIDEVCGDGVTPGSGDAPTVAAVVDANVSHAAAAIGGRSALVRERIDAGDVALVRAVYDIESGRVRWIDGV